MISGREAAMEASELALGSSSFVLEKVLQEVQEVESREHRPDPASSEAASDLKFQPGFVHLLKGRFSLMSRKDRGPASGLDLASEAPRRNLASARHLSRSSDQLDDAPRRQNGWVPRDDLQDALVEQKTRSIHVFARPGDVPAKDRYRNASSKIIIIEASGDHRKAPEAPKETKEPAPPPTKEAWPTPNIVSSTRTFFESNAVQRRPAPRAPSSPPKSVPPQPSGDGPTLRPLLMRRESAPASPDKAEAEPVVSVSEARRLFDRQSAASRQKAVELPKRQAPSPGPVKTTTTTTVINSVKSPSSSVCSTRSITLSINSPKSPSPTVTSVRSTAPVVSPVNSTSPVVGPVRSPVRSTAPAASPVKSTSPVTSPVKSTSPVTSPVKSTSPVTSPVKSTAPAVSPVKSTSPVTSPVKSTSPVTSPVKSTSPVVGPVKATSPVVSPVKATSPVVSPVKSTSPVVSPVRSTAPAVSHVKSPAPTVSPVQLKASSTPSAPAVNGASRSDPASWQNWDDIPLPQRRTFVSEARRVEIPKEQLVASRAKSKSFFFTAAEETAVEPADAMDRTITYKVAPEERQKGPEPLTPRLAQQTIWDSLRNEDYEEEASHVDPELMEEYRQLMAKADEDEEEPLPSTNIDDVPEDPPRPLAITRSSQKAQERKKKRLKQKLQFAEPERLTTTHEYPSERAMIEHLGISPDFDLDTAGELSLDQPSAIFGDDDAEEEPEGRSAAPRVLVSSGTLSSYKSKYTGDDFAWGESSVGNGGGGLTTAAENADADDDPADPDSLEEDVPGEELTWSSAASADLLF